MVDSQPVSPETRPRLGFEIAAVAALIAISVAVAAWFRFTVDDAYIAMRYARHFADGHGLVYNIGERVEGFTSPLWIVVLAALHALGVNLVNGSHAVGIALSAGTIVVAYRLAALALPNGPAIARLVPVLFLSVNWMFVGWATGGLETPLFAFACVLAVYELQRRVVSGSSATWSVPLACLIVVLTRPEGVLFGGILALADFAHGVARGERAIAIVGRWAAAVGLPLIALEAARLAYFGQWLPNTFYVKVNKSSYADRGITFFSAFVRDSLFYLWGPVALAGLFLRDVVTRAVLAYSVIFISYSIWVGGDWMAYRFYHHLLPLLTLPMAHAIAWSVAALRQRRDVPIRVAAGAALSAMLVTCVAVTSKTLAEGRDVKLAWVDLENYAQMDIPESWAIETARGIAKLVGPGQAASATFAGFTAMYTDKPVIDSLGLTDLYVSRLPVSAPGAPGHEKVAPPEYLLSRNVVLVNPWPGRRVEDANREYAAEYAPGYFLYFDSLRSPDETARHIQSRGVDIWRHGEKLPRH